MFLLNKLVLDSESLNHVLENKLDFTSRNNLKFTTMQRKRSQRIISVAQKLREK